MCMGIFASDITPNAKSAILAEESSGKILYEKNINEKRSPASMTKIMTLLLTMEALDSGKIKLDDEVTISSNASGMGGTQIYAEAGSKVKVDVLIKGISVASANDAAVAIGEYIGGTLDNFVSMMNKRADYEAFYAALKEVCTYLAKEMAADGEGATKLVESIVEGADTKEHARILAKSVVCSSLTKAAMYGCDANWGRELCALGYSGVQFDPMKVEMYFKSGDTTMLIFKDGAGVDYSEEEASRLLSNDHVQIISKMNMGTETATAWGCDLTYDYVKINADYRS